MPFKYASLRARLNANSHPEPAPTGAKYKRFAKPCRIWDGMVGGSMGYGKITVRSRYRGDDGQRIVKRLYAHRVSKAEQLGIPVYRLLHCCHDCDRHDCIEPTHIYSKSQAANNRDTVQRGRHANQYGATAT